jgi:hypothetical protein
MTESNPELNRGILNYSSSVLDWSVAPSDDPATSSSGYHPKEWNSNNTFGDIYTFSMFYITDSEDNAYFFDGVFKVEHASQRKLTQHPVQTGANITDHSFQLPMRVTIEVGVSDVMDVYERRWSGSSTSKSVNAYQELKKLQDSGQPLSVTTRLYSYENMVIESITAHEDYKTISSLKALINFQQIITASVSTYKTSSKPMVTDQHAKGPLPTNFSNKSDAMKIVGSSLGDIAQDVLRSFGFVK